MMKLIGSTTSPYVRKVRVVLAEKKLDYRLELQDVWAADTTIAQTNPLGKLLPPHGRERAEVKMWEALADGLLDAAILVRLENTFAGRSEAQRSPAWIARQMAKVEGSLQAMAQGLGDKAYFGGIHPNLADMAVGCALGWLEFRFPEIDWRTAHPNLGRLLDKLMQRPSFADTRPG